MFLLASAIVLAVASPIEELSIETAPSVENHSGSPEKAGPLLEAETAETFGNERTKRCVQARGCMAPGYPGSRFPLPRPNRG